MPLYWAFLQMGAISSDKINLKLTERDTALYRVALAKKRAEAASYG